MTTRHLALAALFVTACSSGGGYYGKLADGGSDGWRGFDFAFPSGRDLAGHGGGDLAGCASVAAPCGAVACCDGLSCQEGLCTPPAMCKSNGVPCAPGDTCCAGLVCNGADQACEACGTVGHRCATVDDCCAAQGFMCDPNSNTCVAKMACKQDGVACNAGPDCCGNLCNGFTKVCGACGATVNAQCASSDDCCGAQGWTCNVGTNRCQQAMMGCKGQNAVCTNSAACCQGLYCDGGKCTNAPMCKPIAATCAVYSDCCEPDSMDCVGTKCCIEAMYQSMFNPVAVKCYANSDCCNTEKCVAGSCQ
jgi:hypothetical protein